MANRHLGRMTLQLKYERDKEVIGAMGVNELDYVMIGQRIKAARCKLGLQQAEVAYRAGLTTSHMSHIETGQPNWLCRLS